MLLLRRKRLKRPPVQPALDRPLQLAQHGRVGPADVVPDDVALLADQHQGRQPLDLEVGTVADVIWILFTSRRPVL